MLDISFFVYAFVSIFSIVNPITAMVTYITVTRGHTPSERVSTAKRAVLIALLLSMAFAFTGDYILKAFGVTVDSLRVAGGVILFMVALQMVQAKISGESATKKEIEAARDGEDVSVFPLATPLLVGPGAITTVIVIMGIATTTIARAEVVLAIVLTFSIAYILFRFSIPINNVLGITGIMVLTRIMGLMLAAIAVGFISTGAWNIYRSFTG
ncbi:MAG: MarC family protein [Methermicoccaceae archaeon]